MGKEEEFKEGEAKGIVTEIQKGKEEGILEGKLDTANNLLKIGMSVEQIAEATKLTIVQINRLKNKQNLKDENY
jgi:predicted transposase/invertase (TIGR01784 family)